MKKQIRNFFRKLFSVTHDNQNSILQSIDSKLQLIDLEITELRKLGLKVEEIGKNQLLDINMRLLQSNPGLSITESKKQLFKDYPKAEVFLADVQKCNLLLLRDLKNYCDEWNIKFWLHAGTLIGALRHDGFIPWDDDVDIGMERCDFDVLLQSLSENSKFQITTYYNQLTCSRQYQLKYNNDVPCFIDIAIWDRSNAKTPEKIITHREKYQVERNNMITSFRNDLNAPKVSDEGYYMMGFYEESIKKEVDELIDNTLDQFSFDKDDENYSLFYSLENYPFSYPLMLHEEMFPLKLVKFEDMELYIPADGERYLVGYGDIYLPPKDIGSTPHLYAFLPFKELIRKFIGEHK